MEFGLSTRNLFIIFVFFSKFKIVSSILINLLLFSLFFISLIYFVNLLETPVNSFNNSKSFFNWLSKLPSIIGLVAINNSDNFTISNSSG